MELLSLIFFGIFPNFINQLIQHNLQIISFFLQDCYNSFDTCSVLGYFLLFIFIVDFCFVYDSNLVSYNLFVLFCLLYALFYYFQLDKTIIHYLSINHDIKINLTCCICSFIRRVIVFACAIKKALFQKKKVIIGRKNVQKGKEYQS